jgi:GNAT superfamily N-acetyltransferase
MTSESRTAPQWGEQARDHFLTRLAGQVGLERHDLARAGTTVVGTDDRAGSAGVACYRADRHLLLWGDPAIVDRLAPLGHDDTVRSDDELAAHLHRAGFEGGGTATMHLLAGPPPAARQTDGTYRGHQLHVDRADDLALIRSLVERCDPEDVEEAELDDLDNLTDTNISVLTPDRPDGLPVAYASAASWIWDHHYGDISVLVDPEHRRRGLGQWVTALTVADIVAEGRAPLYRHDDGNAGSRAVAEAVGFRPATWLSYHRLADAPT